MSVNFFTESVSSICDKYLKLKMNTCRKCEEKFEPSKGFINYCSFKCRQGRIWTDDEKKKKSDACKSSEKVKLAYQAREVYYDYTCECCGEDFKNKKLKEDRRVRCKGCRRKVNRVKNGESILDFSTRTVSKILKKANIPCQNCGYNRVACDIHHIIERKNGGTDDNDNLIVLCPNCHREAHNGLIDKKFLKTHTIAKMFSNYKEFYHLHDDGIIKK